MRAQRLDDSLIEIGQRIGQYPRRSTRRGAVKGRFHGRVLVSGSSVDFRWIVPIHSASTLNRRTVPSHFLNARHAGVYTSGEAANVAALRNITNTVLHVADKFLARTPVKSGRSEQLGNCVPRA